MTDKEKNQDTILDDDLIKALSDLGISKEDIMKAKPSEKESKEEEVEGEKEESEEEMEKAYISAKDELDEMKKAMTEKEAKLAELEAKRKKPVEKAQEDDLNKDKQSSELVKALTDQLGKISETLEASSKSNEDLKKAIEEIKSENAELKKSIDEIGKSPMGMKSVTKHSFIEKGESFQDEQGKTVLSVSANKRQVEDVLEKAMDEESDDTLKKSLADNLIAFNAGGAMISQEIANYLYNKKGIRLLK